MAGTVPIRNTPLLYMANRYRAPLALVRLALNQAAETSGANTLPGYGEVLSDLAEPVLENASRFAGEGLAYTAAATLDVAHSAKDDERRAAAGRRADLLTPIVKAWCSEVAVEVASLGVQVHGGMGFVDDAEISQVYRDSRIGPIFEGTNYIQAQDLLGRKVIRDKGAALGELLAGDRESGTR
jgi:Acyl-CoA dehydrogenase, C-terminal domain